MNLYNTMSHSVEEFKPRDKKEVKVFTCGPSVYRRPHIGNYRTFLYEDILIRYLEYKGHKVNRIINYTDVEDKTIEEALENGITAKELTDKVKNTFLKETSFLKIKLPEFIPSSATSVNTAAEIIKELMDKGYAYSYKGNIFFDPLKKNDFGKLARLDMTKWPKNKIRFKKDTYPGTRWNRGDFILWHGNLNDSSETWDTVIGKGRPSWNVQDPAMIIEHLGPEIDIKCGGIDNIVRHHDYNIAIIEALSGKEFANYYMHGEHLFVDSKKMSKSLGNILYPEDIINDDIDARHLRFFLIETHYRKKLNFTQKKFDQKSCELDSLQNKLDQVLNLPEENYAKECHHLDSIQAYFEEIMDDDLHACKFFMEFSKTLDSILLKHKIINSAQKRKLKDSLSVINEVLQVFKI